MVPRTVRLVLADRPPGHRSPSAPGTTDCLSLLLLELRFHVSFFELEFVPRIGRSVVTT
jgi:hypothetical protein